MKRKLIFLAICLFSISLSSFGQKWKMTRYEAIFGIGAANYFGDIGGSPADGNMLGLRDLTLGDTRPSFYLGARYKILENLSVKFNCNWFCQE